MSNFGKDLEAERVLSIYLDEIYGLLRYEYNRITDLNLQHQGIDLVINFNGIKYNVDEKAQLSYLNKNLTTFTFEMSYLKNGKLKKGWLFDKRKITNYYFLITGIMLKKGKPRLELPSDIKQLKITSVNRKRLISLLDTKGLTEDVCNSIGTHLRSLNRNGGFNIPQLNSQTEGKFFLSSQLTEQPINIQFRLEYLIRCGVAKRIYEI